MADLSTQNLSALPNADDLRRFFQALAMLDVILCDDWERRYFSFDASWSNGRMLGSLHNSSGDELLAVFDRGGCFLKGFVRGSPMSPHKSDSPTVAPGVLDEVPAAFADLLRNPSLDINNTTFCLWTTCAGRRWQRGDVAFPPGPDPDGSEKLLNMLDGNPATYVAWANEYYGVEWEEGRELLVDDAARIYAHEPLSNELVSSIHPDRRLRQVMADATEIGYPFRKKQLH